MLIYKTIIFFVILILSAYYDLKKMIIPDFITYPGIVLGLAFTFLAERTLWIYYIAGGLGGFILILLIAIIGKQLLKKEVIGGGDIKLIIVIGLFTGYTGLLLCFILSSITGILFTYIIYKDLARAIPYGFYLSISAGIIYACLFYFFPLT